MTGVFVSSSCSLFARLWWFIGSRSFLDSLDFVFGFDESWTSAWSKLFSCVGVTAAVVLMVDIVVALGTPGGETAGVGDGDDDRSFCCCTCCWSGRCRNHAGRCICATISSTPSKSSSSSAMVDSLSTWQELLRRD